MYNLNSYAIEKKDTNGKRYLSQIMFPEIPISENDFFITSVRGDRLDLYADRFYNGATELWKIIAQANNLGHGTLAVEPGLQIRIPNPNNLDKIIQDFKNLQKV